MPSPHRNRLSSLPQILTCRSLSHPSPTFLSAFSRLFPLSSSPSRILHLSLEPSAELPAFPNCFLSQSTTFSPGRAPASFQVFISPDLLRTPTLSPPGARPFAPSRHFPVSQASSPLPQARPRPRPPVLSVCLPIYRNRQKIATIMTGSGWYGQLFFIIHLDRIGGSS